MKTERERLRVRPVEEKLSEYGIWAFESRHGSAFSMAETSHRFPKLLLIREGRGKVVGDWGDLTCESGDCLLVPPGMRHRIVDDPMRAISLYGLGISLKHFHSVPDFLEQLPAGAFSAQKVKSVSVEHRMRRILYLDGQCDAASRMACVAAAVELFAELAIALALPGSGPATNDVAVASVDPLLVSYLSWLDHHFYESVTLDAAASACNMSRRSFTDSFKKHVGTTWLDHVHQLRTRHAIELLRSTDRKITSVAFQCGFDDLTTFYRVLYKVTGKRPSDFRINPP
jgi:AraC-like DNA-binding protein/mannose-6-phosphate isomerase-like protein (cupin superfamily)